MMKYLVFLVCLALPAYLIRFSLLGIPTTLLEILIYIVFIVGLFNLKKRAKINKAYFWPIILFLLSGLISVGVSPDKTLALGQFKALFIDPILVFWLIVSYLKVTDISWVIAGLAGSSLIVSLHGLYQKIIGQVTLDGRVVGIFGYSPNYLALFLAPIIAILIVYLVQKQRNIKLSITYGLIIVLDFLVLYFSGSRGGLLALFGGLAICLVIKYWSLIKSKLWLKFSLGLIVLITILAAGWFFKPNFSLDPAVGGRTTSSNNIRAQIWQTSFELGAKSPILGLGLGNYQNSFAQLTYNRVNFPEYITPWAFSPHNVFLMFWLTTGLLGLISFVWLLVLFFRSKNVNRISLVFAAGMVTIILQGLVDTPYFKNDLSLLFWLIFASVILLKNED